MESQASYADAARAGAKVVSRDIPLAATLSQQDVTRWEHLLETYSPERIVDEVMQLPAAQRVRCAQVWCPGDGLPPTTAADADRALQRLLLATDAPGTPPDSNLPQVRSPRNHLRKGKKRRRRAASVMQIPQPESDTSPSPAKASARVRAPAAAKKPSKNLKKLQERIQLWLVGDEEPDNLFGMANIRDLKTTLQEARKPLLQQMSDALGHSSRLSAENMRLEILVWASSQLVEAASQQSQPARTVKDRTHSPIRPRATPAASGVGSDLSSSDTSDSADSNSDSSSSDSEDDLSSLDDKRRRHHRLSSFQAGGRSAAELSSPSSAGKAGFAFVKGAVISIVGKKASSSTVLRVMDTLREAAQSREARIGVERLVSAMSRHLQEEAPKGLNVRSGKFFGAHKPVAARDVTSPWADIEVSYNFGQEDSILADELTDEGIQTLSTENEQLIITMTSNFVQRLHKCPSVYGWAELASGAGAAAMEYIWKPFLGWLQPQGNSDEIFGQLTRRLARVISNMAADIAICDEAGAKRLLSSLIATLVSVQALIETRRASESTWPKIVTRWLDGLRNQAHLDMLLSSGSRSAYTLRAVTELGGGAASTTPWPLTNRPPPPSAPPRINFGKEVQQSRGTQAKTPHSFNFCGVCMRANHCLWNCRSVVNNLRQRVQQGTSTQQAADALIKKTRDKYEQMGLTFIQAFDKRPGKTREALLAKLTT